MRRLTAINFIYQFTWAAIAITLPLYLIKKQVNVEEIGLILSIVPVAMIFLRTFLAMLADVMGTRIFFVFQGIFQALAAGVYAVASVPLHFGVGKVFEGSAYSLFWAVDRTAIFLAAEKKGLEAAKMFTVRMGAAALGLAAAGLIAFNFSFEAVFQLLFVLGLATFVLALSRHNSGGRRKKLLQTLDLKNKDIVFWEASLAMAFAIAHFSLLFVFLLPVFLELSMGLDYATIGFFEMLYFIGIGTGGYTASRMGLKEGRLYALQLFAIPLLVALPYSGNLFAPLLMLAGIGSGIAFGMYEELVAEVTSREENVSTAVALLHNPGRLLEFSVLAASGFMFASLGSNTLFIVCALFLLIFIVLTKRLLGRLGIS